MRRNAQPVLMAHRKETSLLGWVLAALWIGLALTLGSSLLSVFEHLFNPLLKALTL